VTQVHLGATPGHVQGVHFVAHRQPFEFHVVAAERVESVDDFEMTQSGKDRGRREGRKAQLLLCPTYLGGSKKGGPYSFGKEMVSAKVGAASGTLDTSTFSDARTFSTTFGTTQKLLLLRRLKENGPTVQSRALT